MGKRNSEQNQDIKKIMQPHQFFLVLKFSCDRFCGQNLIHHHPPPKKKKKEKNFLHLP